MYKETYIYKVIWIRDEKVRIQLGEHKRDRVTIPLKIIKGTPKKDGQLRIVQDVEPEEWKARILSAEVPKRKHVCRGSWRWQSHNFTNVTLMCNVCHKRHERPMTDDEKFVMFDGRFNNPVDSLFPKKGVKHIHTVWHDFRDKFLEKDGMTFKYSGYDFIQKVERWASKQEPEDVRMVHVDDSHHMGSRIYFIEHQTDSTYMGTTAVYIGQCGDVVQFFMYPGHRSEIIEALLQIRKHSSAVVLIENKQNKEKSYRLRKLFKNG